MHIVPKIKYTVLYSVQNIKSPQMTGAEGPSCSNVAIGKLSLVAKRQLTKRIKPS